MKRNDTYYGFGAKYAYATLIAVELEKIAQPPIGRVLAEGAERVVRGATRGGTEIARSIGGPPTRVRAITRGGTRVSRAIGEPPTRILPASEYKDLISAGAQPLAPKPVGSASETQIVPGKGGMPTEEAWQQAHHPNPPEKPEAGAPVIERRVTPGVSKTYQEPSLAAKATTLGLGGYGLYSLLQPAAGMGSQPGPAPYNGLFPLPQQPYGMQPYSTPWAY